MDKANNKRIVNECSARRRLFIHIQTQHCRNKMTPPKPVVGRQQDPLWPRYSAEIEEVGNGIKSVQSTRVGKSYLIDDSAYAMLSEESISNTTRAKITTRIIVEDEKFVVRPSIITEEESRPAKSEHERAALLLRLLNVGPITLSWNNERSDVHVDDWLETRLAWTKPANQMLLANTESSEWMRLLRLIQSSRQRGLLDWELNADVKIMTIMLTPSGQDYVATAANSPDIARNMWDAESGRRRMNVDANFIIPTSHQDVRINIKDNTRLFIVGPNGSGKSALMQHIAVSVSDKIRRITAHRKTWMESSTIDITSQARRQIDDQSTNQDRDVELRWKDKNSQTQIISVLFDLVANDNDQARRIAQHVRANNTKSAERIANEEPSIFDQINRLLALAGLTVEIENSRGEELLARRTDTIQQYSLAQMSDGERNAVILAANVLTVDPGTILLIDEPERHLHRAVIEPFLTALFAQRTDCPFIVATHDIALPIANPNASVLIVSSCQWNGNEPSSWDAKLLPENTDLPEDIKRAVLGSRKKILFVEGDSQSLDITLYGVLFPGLSVHPVGGCDDVIKAVDGLRNSAGLHDVEAFGLIDGDNREPKEKERLARRNIFSLKAYSVESVYYCSDAIDAIAYRQAESLGSDANQMIKDATTAALNTLRQSGLADRMAARYCDRKVREYIQSQMPDWKSIPDNATISLEVGDWYRNELAHFDNLLSNEDLATLIERYPIRDSEVPGSIVGALQLKNIKQYEAMLIARAQADTNLADKLRQRIGALTDALKGRSS